MKTSSLSKLKGLLKDSDPNLKEADEAFGAGLILLRISQTGDWNQRSLAAFTELSRDLVRKCTSNLRSCGYHSPDGKLRTDWTEGDIAFWIDVTVALGLVRRTMKPGKPPKVAVPV